MKLLTWPIVLVTGLLSLSQSPDDMLPRRGYFGVSLEKAEGGARVFAVAQDSTAEAEGIVIGDVISAVDSRPVTSPEVAVSAIGRHKSGELVKIDVQRN